MVVVVVVVVWAGGQGVRSEVWVRGGGGSVPISVMRYPAVGRNTPHQVEGSHGGY